MGWVGMEWDDAVLFGSKIQRDTGSFHVVIKHAPIPVSSLKSVLDFLQKGEWYPSSAVFVRHAQVS